METVETILLAVLVVWAITAEIRLFKGLQMLVRWGELHSGLSRAFWTHVNNKKHAA